MHDWFTKDYETHRQAEYERVRAKHPELVTQSFECHAGWFPILENFFDEVARLIEAHPGSKLRLQQVKEKFAGLRIYTWPTDDIADEVEAAYDRAAALSLTTCDVCGKSGRVRNRGGFFMTRCEEHAEGAEPARKDGES